MRRNFALAFFLVLLLLSYLALLDRIAPYIGITLRPRPLQHVWPSRQQTFLFDLAALPLFHRGDVSQGTAFNIDGAERWLTARHVVTPCLAGQFSGQIDGEPINLVTADGHNDVAVVRTAGHSAHRLGLRIIYAPDDKAEHATIVGFPGNSAAEVEVERIGSGVARSVGRAEEVSVWVTGDRSPPGDYGLAGMSGAPVLDDFNNVVGVLSAEVPRRGRVLVARIGDWTATEGQHIAPARTFDEHLPSGELIRRMVEDRAVVRLRCSS